MKGLDLLAKACEPEPDPNQFSDPSGSIQITDDQLNSIADLIIKKLQSTSTEPDPDPEPDPEPINEDEGGDPDAT